MVEYGEKLFLFLPRMENGLQFWVEGDTIEWIMYA